MSGLSDPAPTANSLPAQPSSAPSTDGLRGVKSVRGRRSGGATSTAAAAATPVGPGPRDDGGSGRAFFPVPDAGGGECIMTELSEAERYLLSVRQQHAALPAFTKVVNPYSRPKTPAGAESALLGGKLSPTSSSGAPSVVLAAPAVALGSTTTGRHPFQPTDAWRKTFLDHFLDLRANLVHEETRPEPAYAQQRIPERYLPVPKNGDCRGWRQYMIGAKRRRLHGGEESELLPTAPVALLMATIEPGGMVVDGADAIPTKAAGVSPTAASGAQTLALGAHVTPSSATYDDEEEEEAMNDGFAGADDEEAALNDGDEYDDAYNNDDPTPMTAEEAFDAFEFGDWYDPAGEDGADGDGAAATGATAHRDDAEDDDDELSETEVDEAELEPHEPRHVGREPSLSLIQGFSDKTTLAVLRHITALVETPATPTLAPGLARWAFALLAHLDPTTGLLTGEQTSHLRSLARACLAVIEAHVEALVADGDRARWLGPAKVEERMGCWMIWAAVVGVWAQRDLEDEMAKVLASDRIA